MQDEKLDKYKATYYNIFKPFNEPNVSTNNAIGTGGGFMKKQVGIVDVAQEAGVSPATVSYVLNDAPVVIKQETRERVLAVADKLHYVPDQAAKTLVSSRKSRGKSMLIGVVIPQTEPGKYFMFSNPFYGDFLSAVEYEARKANYHLLISGVNADESYARIAKMRSLDGIVIVGKYPSADIDEYKKANIPVVLVDCYCDDDHFFHSVRTDDRHGGYLATQYLIDHGHRDIAFVAGDLKENGVNYMRFLGYCDALREAGIPLDEGLVFEGSVDFEYGSQAARQLVRQCAEGTAHATAVFATADILAIGMMKGLRDAGMSVPEDFSVVGFDDVYFAEISSLTTVRQNISEKGREAAKIMIAAAGSDPIKYPRTERVIPMELVERASVRDIRQSR